METIKLYSDLNLPAQYMVSNVIKNTQPDNILKYKYVYGTWETHQWIKMFMVPMAVRSVLFQGNMFDIQGATKVTINSKTYTKIKMLIPDLLFVVRNTIDSEEPADLYTFRIVGQFDPTDLTNLSPAPLPNLYVSGQVCQSGKLSVLKMCKDSISHVLKNTFDISEYFIDMFLNSAYNNDLDGTFVDTVKELGFDTVHEYIKTASNPNKFSFLKEKFMNVNRFNTNTFRNNFIQSKSDTMKATSLFENDFIQMNGDCNPVYINLLTDDIFKKKITIGDNIKYNGEFVRVLSFGPLVTNTNIFRNESTYQDGHYIKYMTESYQIGFINFSEISEKVELGKPIELSEEDFPEGCTLNGFISFQSSYRRIMGIVKIEGNDQYFYKLASTNIDIFDYANSKDYDKPYPLGYLYSKSEFENDCYCTNVIYSSGGIDIISVDTNKKYSNEYIDKNLLVSQGNGTMFIQEGSEIVRHYDDSFIEVDSFELFDIVEEEHIVLPDSTVIPYLTELRYEGNRCKLYGENIDPYLYSGENISQEVNKLVNKWNEQGKTTNTIIKNQYNYKLVETSIGGNFFRLPILGGDENEYCDQYFIKGFLYDNENNSVNVDFQNNTNDELTSVPLNYLMYFQNDPTFPKHSELFISGNNPDARYVGKYVSIKDSVYVGTTYRTCQIYSKRKTIRIIDVDFSSSDTFNKFFASDKIIYCISKEIDPFESIFDLKEEKDFSEHRSEEIVLSDSYREVHHVPSSAYSYNKLMQPKFNQIILDLNGDDYND